MSGGLHHLADEDGADQPEGDREAECAADPGQHRRGARPLRWALQVRTLILAPSGAQGVSFSICPSIQSKAKYFLKPQSSFEPQNNSLSLVLDQSQRILHLSDRLQAKDFIKPQTSSLRIRMILSLFSS